MHGFIRKVAVAAVLVTAIGVAATAQAGNTLYSVGGWYQNYAVPSAPKQSASSTTVVIVKKTESHDKRGYFKKHAAPEAKTKPVLRKRYHRAEPVRRQVHASGYRW